MNGPHYRRCIARVKSNNELPKTAEYERHMKQRWAIQWWERFTWALKKLPFRYGENLAATNVRAHSTPYEYRHRANSDSGRQQLRHVSSGQYGWNVAS